MARRSRKPATAVQRRRGADQGAPQPSEAARRRRLSRGDELVLELLAILRRLELRRFNLGGAGWLLGLFLVHSTLSSFSPGPDGVVRLVRSIENLSNHTGYRQ